MGRSNCRRTNKKTQKGEGIIMAKWYETQSGYKRVKTSLYLKKEVWDKLEEISKKNELSLSETGQRLMVQSMGGMI